MEMNLSKFSTALVNLTRFNLVRPATEEMQLNLAGLAIEKYCPDWKKNLCRPYNKIFVHRQKTDLIPKNFAEVRKYLAIYKKIWTNSEESQRKYKRICPSKENLSHDKFDQTAVFPESYTPGPFPGPSPGLTLCHLIFHTPLIVRAAAFASWPEEKYDAM